MARQRGGAVLAPAAVLAAALGLLAWLPGRLGFVGATAPALQPPRAGGAATALHAAKAAPPKKTRLSLAEAIERQKENQAAKGDKKDDAKLSKEKTFWEGPPSSTEVFAPLLSCLVVIGIVPFIASVNRQFRVKYKITDRRVSVSGGWDGKDVTEFSYQEIYEMKYGMRWLGYCADMRINLRDGAKVELFGLLNFYQNYEYIYNRIDKEARKRSDKPPGELE
ncbi:unnamed protein product [Prorocentrum cordatum]|uniref:YdbS-like PH domain-containing protein n=1 Tax=Prorocentrum cordatum TaxID=2364126 RepID=A0ABN9TKR5_9DINO|nr:unnamed protein product [Polarella glacialis]